MKKFLIIALLLMFLMPFALAAPNVYDQMRGRQMIPTGGPWLADDQKLYLGDDKDVYIEFDSDGTGQLNIYGQTLVVPIPMNNMTTGPVGAFYGMGNSYQVIGIVEKHQVANTNGATATIVKAPGTRALAASVNVSTAAIALSSTINTAQSPGISTVTGVTLCNATDTLGVVLSTRPLDYKGTIYILLKRLT